MSSSKRLTVLLLAAILGTTAAVATASNLFGSLNKQQAVANAETVEDISQPPNVAKSMDPFEDEGSVDAVARVRTDVVDDFRELRAIQAPVSVPSDLRDLLEHVFAGDVLSARVLSVTQDILAAASDPSYHQYTGNDFIVDRWEGVRVTGTTAFALFRGHDRFTYPTETPYEGDSYQWQVNLKLEEGRWKLVRYYSVVGVSPSER